jgi:hypothetical protein
LLLLDSERRITTKTVISMFAASVAVLVLLAGAAAAVREQCPTLGEAVQSRADYNHPSLGLRWFEARGLQRNRRYGCRSGVYAKGRAPPYNFGLNCACSAVEECVGGDMEYTTNSDSKHTSDLGTCACCATWVIWSIVVLCVAAVLTAFHVVPYLKRKYWPSPVERLRRDARAKVNNMSAAAVLEDARGADEEMRAVAVDRKKKKLRQRRVSPPPSEQADDRAKLVGPEGSPAVSQPDGDASAFGAPPSLSYGGDEDIDTR